MISRSPAPATLRLAIGRVDAASAPSAEANAYDTRFKMLYSSTGLYFLMDATDRKLTATMTEDFMDLWNEDVFEVFLWTDERYPVYLEYEISPFNHELPILIPNFGGQFLGWRPWHYEQDRRHAQGHEHHRRAQRVGSGYPGVARRVLLSVRAAAAAPERPAKAGHALARKFLSHGLRRRQAHAVGLGSGRTEFPRVREVRRLVIRGEVASGRRNGRNGRHFLACSMDSSVHDARVT